MFLLPPHHSSALFPTPFSEPGGLKRRVKRKTGWNRHGTLCIHGRFRTATLLLALFLVCAVLLVRGVPVVGKGDSVLPQTATDYGDKAFWRKESRAKWSVADDDPICNAILQEARRRRRQWPELSPIDPNLCRQLGIRKYDGRHVAFYTDMPANEELDGYVNVMDAAVPELCRWFGFPETAFAEWHIEAFLMSDREPFRKLGVLDGVPEVVHGYAFRDRIFGVDHSYGYYNRFLLLHELVHSFMYEVFGSLRPRYYSEGMAEYLALHRIENDELRIAFMPDEMEETPGFNRLGQIREEVAGGKIPGVTEIMSFAPEDFASTLTYAWSWTFVAFLQHSPRYADIVKKMPYYMMAPDPSARVRELLGKDWNAFQADWLDFARWFGYSLRDPLPATDYKPGRDSADLRTDSGVSCPVSASLGWVNSGIRVEAGKSYRVRGTGRFELYDSRGMIPCESWGVTLKYCYGRPRGQLVMTVVPNLTKELLKEKTIWRDVYPVNATKRLTPDVSGTLFFRISDNPAWLSKNKGGVTAHVREEME